MPVTGMYRSMTNLHWINQRSHSVVEDGLTLNRLIGRVEAVQCSVDQQLGQHGQLLNRQCHIAPRTFELERQVGGHGVDRGKGFTGVDQQGWCVYVGDNGEYMTDGSRVNGVTQTGTDGVLGGFGKLYWIEVF